MVLASRLERHTVNLTLPAGVWVDAFSGETYEGAVALEAAGGRVLLQQP